MSKEERFNYYINKKDDRDWFIDDRVKEEEITSFKGIVEVLNQQDRRIEELLKANDSFGMIGNIIMEHYGKKDLCVKDVEDYANHIKEQDHKIAVLERALELACKEVLTGWCSDYCGRGMNCNDCHYKEISSTDYFKSQAESEIKNNKEGV